MFFADFSDLTDSFNDAVSSFAHTAGMAMAVGAVFNTVSSRDRDQDPEVAPLKFVAKTSLLGMLL